MPCITTYATKNFYSRVAPFIFGNAVVELQIPNIKQKQIAFLHFLLLPLALKRSLIFLLDLNVPCFDMTI